MTGLIFIVTMEGRKIIQKVTYRQFCSSRDARLVGSLIGGAFHPVLKASLSVKLGVRIMTSKGKEQT